MENQAEAQPRIDEADFLHQLKNVEAAEAAKCLEWLKQSLIEHYQAQAEMQNNKLDSIKASINVLSGRLSDEPGYPTRSY